MTWRRALVAAAVLVLVAAAAVIIDVRRDDQPTTTPDETPPPDLEQAVELADVHVEGITTADVAAMIEDLCDHRDAEAVALRLTERGVRDQQQVLLVVQGLGTGASRYCPDVAASDPQLINDVYNLMVQESSSERP